MATLPDIDTSNVGGITFYNVKDEQGVSDADFDPMEFADWDQLSDVEIYDNGIDGYIKGNIYIGSSDSPGGVISRFRCKNDGWVICWSPTSDNYFGTGEFNDGTTTSLRGDYNYYGVGSGKYYWTILEDALSHAGYGITVSPGETVLGQYHFSYPDASNITVIYSDGTTKWSYTSSVDRKFHSLIMRNIDGSGILANSDAVSVLSRNTASQNSHSTVDLLNEECAGFSFNESITPGETYEFAGTALNESVMVSIWS